MLESTLPGFTEAEALGERDGEFIAELRDLLERHGNIDRFGLCLLHDHFPVQRDELLMETNDPATRTLTSTPQPIAALEEFKGTMWRLHRSGSGDVSPTRTVQVLRGVPCEILQGCKEDKCK